MRLSIQNNVKVAMSEQTHINLISWNVNGIRAVHRKGFMDWFNSAQPDILALQEIRAMTDQIPKDIRTLEHYHDFWLSAEKKGYSGVGLLTKTQPLNVQYGLGQPEFDSEGRVMTAEFEDFTLINAYFPSGSSGQERIAYKLAFNEAFLNHCEDLGSNSKPLIFCGDVNIAHHPIDLTHPKANEKNSGFLPEEREWLDRITAMGYIDTYRHFYPDTAEMYSWWSMRQQAREKNVGWRIDYIIASKELEANLKAADILTDVMGSDHCPISLDFEIPVGE